MQKIQRLLSAVGLFTVLAVVIPLGMFFALPLYVAYVYYLAQR